MMRGTECWLAGARRRHRGPLTQFCLLRLPSVQFHTTFPRSVFANQKPESLCYRERHRKDGKGVHTSRSKIRRKITKVTAKIRVNNKSVTKPKNQPKQSHASKCIFCLLSKVIENFCWHNVSTFADVSLLIKFLHAHASLFPAQTMGSITAINLFAKQVLRTLRGFCVFYYQKFLGVQ